MQILRASKSPTVYSRPARRGNCDRGSSGRSDLWGHEKSESTMPALSNGSRCAVRNFARMNPWISLDDLTQEAHLAALEAAKTWSPTGGASAEWYEARAVSLALSRLVSEMRVPVSLPKHHGSTREAALSAMGVCLVSVSDDGDEVESAAVGHLSVESYEALEDKLDRAQAAREVRRLMGEESASAQAVLLGEEKPESVARRLGEDVQRVYAQAARAVRRIKAAFGGEIKKDRRVYRKATATTRAHDAAAAVAFLRTMKAAFAGMRGGAEIAGRKVAAQFTRGRILRSPARAEGWAGTRRRGGQTGKIPGRAPEFACAAAGRDSWPPHYFNGPPDHRREVVS